MRHLGICLVALAVVFSTSQLEAQELKYPKAKHVDQVDEYFGVKVPDPSAGWKTTFARPTKSNNGSTPKTRSR